MTNARIPKAISHQKMQNLANIPLFHKLNGKSIIIAGHEVGALWKTELLAATGAQIDLFLGAPRNDEHARIFAGLGNVAIHERGWCAADLEDRAIAVSQSVSDEDACAFVAAARAHKVAVNIIDKPEYCDFQFGAIVNRSPLIIGISTDGAAPALGQELRGRLEVLLPQKITAWLRAAANWRPKIKAMGLAAAFRRDFWHKFAQRALDNPNDAPDDAIIENMLKTTTESGGRVTLVGAGPGDPELLTLGALRALQSADVVLVDDLVAPEIIDFARREAEIISVGKRGRQPSIAQTTIIELMLKYAQQNKHVVRLKGGDILVFARATEEIAACAAAGIPIKLLSGISAAQGIAATLGISMTDREYSQKVQFITAAGKRGGLAPEINFSAIADNDATTFVYMPRYNIEMFVKNALAAGLDPNIPAAIITDGTRAEQRNIFTNIAQTQSKFAELPLAGPEILVIGNVLKNSPFYQA